MSTPLTHAVREFRVNEGPTDFVVEQIQTVGYAVVPSGFTSEKLSTISEKIDGIYDQQVAEIGGIERLAKIREADVVRCLIGYDDFFLELARHPTILAVANELLGQAFTLMSQNGMVARPSKQHYQTTWHRDLNYQHFVSSRPLALSALYAIDEFRHENGATHVLPGTHKVEAFPSPEWIAAHEVTVTAPAGAIILFDAMMYHRMGNNTSKNIRRGVNHIYTLPLIRQQISLPSMLGGKFSDDPSLALFLGYDIETGESVQQWREGKLASAERGLVSGPAGTSAAGGGTR